MGKITLEELRELRERARAELARRGVDASGGDIIVGMGTCGLAAGARETMSTLVEELNRRGLSNVRVRPTGCMGLCHSEPTVEVRIPGMPAVIYGKVTPEVAQRIVEEHVLGHKLLDDHVYDRPAPDLMSPPARPGK